MTKEEQPQKAEVETMLADLQREVEVERERRYSVGHIISPLSYVTSYKRRGLA